MPRFENRQPSFRGANILRYHILKYLSRVNGKLKLENIIDNVIAK
jgi:hypothetical protein